ncbi:hypothetical protein [Bailinhaonella thermotolerans]|uniref:hypothetical protein n=1 Tax=Bailinhaonella thermotolerans TaxID=1070861 RepID=UPI001F5BE7B1|nr:hypothetical protein [Bailinhaonella thermotolerans]
MAQDRLDGGGRVGLDVGQQVVRQGRRRVRGRGGVEGQGAQQEQGAGELQVG